MVVICYLRLVQSQGNPGPSAALMWNRVVVIKMTAPQFRTRCCRRFRQVIGRMVLESVFKSLLMYSPNSNSLNFAGHRQISIDSLRLAMPSTEQHWYVWPWECLHNPHVWETLGQYWQKQWLVGILKKDERCVHACMHECVVCIFSYVMRRCIHA